MVVTAVLLSCERLDAGQEASNSATMPPTKWGGPSSAPPVGMKQMETYEPGSRSSIAAASLPGASANTTPAIDTLLITSSSGRASRSSIGSTTPALRRNSTISWGSWCSVSLVKRIDTRDRNGVVEGKSGVVRVDYGGRRTIQKKK